MSFYYLLNLELTDDTGLSGQHTLGGSSCYLYSSNYGHELLLAFSVGAGD